MFCHVWTLEAPWQEDLALFSHTASLQSAQHKFDHAVKIFPWFPFIFVLNLIIYTGFLFHVWSYLLHTIPSVFSSLTYELLVLATPTFAPHLCLCQSVSLCLAYALRFCLGGSVYPSHSLPPSSGSLLQVSQGSPTCPFPALPGDNVNYFIIGLIILLFNEMELSLGLEPCLCILVFRRAAQALTCCLMRTRATHIRPSELAECGLLGRQPRQLHVLIHLSLNTL